MHDTNIVYSFMEQKIQCPECHIWNSNDNSFCEKCGARLHPFVGEWWKDYNMSPVRLTKFKLPWGGYYLYAFSLIISIIIIFYLSVGICGLFLEIFPGIFGYHDLRYEGWNIAISVLISLAFGLSLLFFWFKYFLSIRFAPNWFRKQKRELLDDDYIENYKSRKDHYVLIARGNGSSHKFGIFDVQKINVCVPMKYDELKWSEKGKLLNGILNGYPVVIDVNGNNYQ